MTQWQVGRRTFLGYGTLAAAGLVVDRFGRPLLARVPRFCCANIFPGSRLQNIVLREDSSISSNTE